MLYQLSYEASPEAGQARVQSIPVIWREWCQVYMIKISLTYIFYPQFTHMIFIIYTQDSVTQENRESNCRAVASWANVFNVAGSFLATRLLRTIPIVTKANVKMNLKLVRDLHSVFIPRLVKLHKIEIITNIMVTRYLSFSWLHPVPQLHQP